MRNLALIVAPLMLAGVAFSQSFNVDIGGGAAATPLPSTTFGAGAAQPAFWNGIDPAVAGTPIALSNIGGVATTATFARTAGSGTQLNFDNTNTSGDDQALLDDGDYPPSSGATWTFAGLAAGTYEVYTYAWAPDGATFQSRVSVNGGPQTCVGGTFTGTYLVPITHALDTVTVAAGGSINIAFISLPCVSFHTFVGAQIKQQGPPPVFFCDGSGVGSACLACGNNGAPTNGCANSSFPAGAHLAASGNAGASAGTDTLVLTCTNMTGPGLFFQASGVAGSPIPFGDGELCASQGIIRLGVVFPGPPSPANTASYPGGLTPNPIHIGGGPLVAGDIRHYQCWYRDAITFCTSATFNLSQGVTLTWGP